MRVYYSRSALPRPLNTQLNCRKSYVWDSRVSIINSFNFNKEILDQDALLCMGSLDVDALYTSIPLDETINIAVEERFRNNIAVNGLTKEDVLNLLLFATKGTLFLFDGDYYYQTDGVAIGSPLGPHLAHLFMSFCGQIWLQDCP